MVTLKILSLTTIPSSTTFLYTPPSIPQYLNYLWVSSAWSFASISLLLSAGVQLVLHYTSGSELREFVLFLGTGPKILENRPLAFE